MSVIIQNFPTIKQGSDFQTTLPLSSPGLDPSRTSFVCQIRRVPGGPLLAEPDTTWNGTTLTIKIAGIETAKIPGTGPLGSPVQNNWVYDILAILPDGSRICIAEGFVPVDPAVSEV